MSTLRFAVHPEWLDVVRRSIAQAPSGVEIAIEPSRYIEPGTAVALDEFTAKAMGEQVISLSDRRRR